MNQKPQASFVERAARPDASAWVGANAGSGKTYILVTRLVRLLLAGVAPERLLCLTYTRNAAAEMQDRLFTLLAEWALLDDDGLRIAIAERLEIKPSAEALARARILFARALETPGGLRVQTIHAFCESLLRRFPLEAGLSPQFELMDERQAQDIHQGLVRRLLGSPDEPELADALALLTRQMSEDDLYRLAGELLRQTPYPVDGDLSSRLAGLQKTLELPTPLPTADGLMQAHMRAHANDIKAIGKWLAALTQKNDIKQYERFTAWHEAALRPADESHALLVSLFLTDKGEPRNLVNKSTAVAHPALAARSAWR